MNDFDLEIFETIQKAFNVLSNTQPKPEYIYVPIHPKTLKKFIKKGWIKKVNEEYVINK